MIAIASWFGSELWVALTEIGTAAVVDLILTVALAVMGKLLTPFVWRRVPQFLFTNVLPYAIGVILGAVLTRYRPELRTEYLVTATALAAWLARDWRSKFTVLLGFKPPETLNQTDKAA